MDIEDSLESSPTWAVAVVSSVLIVLALLIEHALHLLTRFVRRRKRKSLNQAVYQIKAELRNLGFMSLLLTMAKQPISKICIPKSLGDSFLPCKDVSGFVMNGEEEVEYSCGKEGKVALVSAEGIQQLQMLIFVLVIFHVISCLVTLGLGEAKMKRWESWEKETRTLEHQLSNDPRRFKLTRQTSFGQRHLKFWSNHRPLLWLVCFLRQFTDSMSKADYYALRNGFIKVHLSKDNIFDFHKFLRRSLDQDFVIVIRISFWIWIYAVFFIFFNAHEFYNHYWLPFIPLVMLLAIGTKLEIVITKLCLKSSKQSALIPGVISVNPDGNFFWFAQPQLLLHVVHFILIQNSFQLAFFTWTWYKFGFRSCFHREIEDVVLTFGISMLVQFICAYVTLPLFALVTQMGSSMKETVFTDSIVTGLKRWHNIARRSLSKKKFISSSPSMQPLQCPRTRISSFNAHILTASQFKYPSGRLELLEIQKVAEEMIDCSAKNIPYDGEISFKLWRKQGGTFQQGGSSLT